AGRLPSRPASPAGTGEHFPYQSRLVPRVRIASRARPLYLLDQRRPHRHGSHSQPLVLLGVDLRTARRSLGTGRTSLRPGPAFPAPSLTLGSSSEPAQAA